MTMTCEQPLSLTGVRLPANGRRQWNDQDTAAFAVEPIRRRLHGQGRTAHPRAKRLPITGDAGAAPTAAAPPRAWKPELARLAAETGLTSVAGGPGPAGRGVLADRRGARSR